MFDDLILMKSQATLPKHLNAVEIKEFTPPKATKFKTKKRIGNLKTEAEVEPLPYNSDEDDGDVSSDSEVLSLTESERKLVEMDILNENIMDMIKGRKRESGKSKK